MDLFNQILTVLELMLTSLLLINSIIILALIIAIYHILCHCLRDKKHIYALLKNKDPEKVELKDLKSIPLINIIIPAWNEGKLFENCLSSIKRLTYPNLKVIINAGGNEETIKIAKSYEKYKNFTVLNQKFGGKMKALNECLENVTEGIIYSIDADVILTDEIFLRMIYPIINENENVTAASVRPLNNQANNAIVKYILINRYDPFTYKFSRYGRKEISGPNTCFKYEVIKAIGKFPNDTLFLESDRFRAPTIISKGYKIFWLSDYRGYVYTNYPTSLKEYFFQEFRWRKNSLTNPFLERIKKNILRFITLFLFSVFIVMFPFLFFINFGLVMIDLLIILSVFLKKIRKCTFFKTVVDKTYYQKFGFLFFIKMVFYIYFDAIITIFIAFDLIFGKKEHPMINKTI